MASGGGGDGGVGGGGFDPSNLHLRKELTQIKKTAKALRDPGTTSTWRSPLSSARSAIQLSNTSKLHYYQHHQYKNSTNNVSINPNSNDVNFTLENEKVREKEKTKVYLHNWKMQRSESEKSKKIRNEKARNSTSTADESVSIDEDSLSDARNLGNDSKSDTYISDKYASLIFKCKDTSFTPSIRRAVKKKTRRNTYSSENLQQHIAILSRGSKRVLDSRPRRDDSNSLVDQSDDSMVSPLLAKLKNRKLDRFTAKLLRDSKKEDSSYTYSTPALSTSSFKKYYLKYPSTVGSWDESLDDENLLDLRGPQGCGIPCYWSRRSTPKSRGSCYSPSLSDNLRRKGTTLKKKLYTRKGDNGIIPLLGIKNGSSVGSMNSDDELSTNFTELDLEALNRLDGRRWSTSVRSHDGLELIAINNEEDEEEGSPENISRKYKPMFFDELIGQNIVVQSLMNAISRGRIAPVYLFQGPRGTGKTSTARIFAAALNCLAIDESKPCGVCKQCAGKNGDIIEVDGANKKGIEKIKYLLKNLSRAPLSTFSRYQVFVVDECHLLPSKTWMAFLKFLEPPPPRVVFLLVTTDHENLPRTVLSRCQKYVFSKIRDSDIVTRLRKIVDEECLEVELEALDLIAMNADGSLRDAETMLEQLSLLGSRITTSLVNELVGVVSDEKLLELLELAMSSDTAETVKRARELLDSGVDPIVLMSQLASLIMDIIAGSRPNVDVKLNDSSISGGSLTDMELDRLKHALKLLSDAEKQLRVSSERSTWFTATLLQLGSLPTPDHTQSGSSRRQSSRATEEDRDSNSVKHRTETYHAPRKSTNHESTHLIDGETFASSSDSHILENIWTKCVEKCHSRTLRQLLLTYGKLVSISQLEGVFVAYIAFEDSDVKIRAERFLSSITNSFEFVLRSNVEVKIVSDNLRTLPEKQIENSSSNDSKKSSKVPVQRIESIIHEQRLETAWLQAMEKGTPGSMTRMKLERNQVLPQDVRNNEMESINLGDEDEEKLNLDIKTLMITDGKALENDQIRRIERDRLPLSPSLLHEATFTDNSQMGYESGSVAGGGCSSLFCWNNKKPRKRVKAKQGTPMARSHRNGQFLWLGECAKPRKPPSKLRR